MTRWVVDTSLVLGWLLHEEMPKGVTQLREAIERAPALVPSIWRLEIGNALLVAAKRRRMSADELEWKIRMARSFPVVADFGDANRGLCGVWDVARQHGLTTYDAAYLELAMRYDYGLASLDASLNRAASAVGLPVL